MRKSATSKSFLLESDSLISKASNFLNPIVLDTAIDTFIELVDKLLRLLINSKFSLYDLLELSEFDSTLDSAFDLSEFLSHFLDLV